MNWISVEEQLPKEGQHVLIYGFRGYEVDYIIFVDEERNKYIWAKVLDHERDFITHWMELPKPPEDK